jgi:hypothetical protein
VVTSGREDGLTPVVPVLLRGGAAPPETLAMLDLGTEHALFLSTMLATRMTPSESVHVPDEVLLYEAWMTRAGSTKLAGFAPVVEALSAIAFGTGHLCDLAAAASARADASAGNAAAAMAATVSALSAGKASLTTEQSAAIDLAARGVAHGLTGSCYLDRHQTREAAPEIQRLVSAAEALGAERKEIEAQLAQLGNGDPEKTKAYLSGIMFGTIKDRLLRTGALDALADLEVARALRGYVHAAAGVIEGAKRKL